MKVPRACVYRCRCWGGKIPGCLRYICLLCSPAPWKLYNTSQNSAVTGRASFDLVARKKNKQKTTDLRVALDRVFIAVDGGGFCLCHVTLEESVAVGVGVLGGTDVSVEGVGGRADGQLLWSHRLSCWRWKHGLRSAGNRHADATDRGTKALPICAAWGRLMAFFALMASLMRSTSCW